MGVRWRRPRAERLILSFGNVRLVGMTDKELQKVYKISASIAARQILFILPQDIIDNTIKAFSTSATSATGYGTGGAPSGRYFAPATASGLRPGRRHGRLRGDDPGDGAEDREPST